MDNAKILEPYLPPGTALMMAKWIDYFQVELSINKPRESVFGDYRHPHGGKGHRISVNRNLNPYAFLITLIHEFAHLTNWNKHANRVKPHGEEWKNEYRNLMQPFLDRRIFPEEIERAVRKYITNPAASSCTDVHLLKVLKRFDQHQHTVFVSNVPAGAMFRLRNGRTFQKLELLRKRYRCKEISSGDIYLFSPVMEVYLG
jgi:hypothetical protein